MKKLGLDEMTDTLFAGFVYFDPRTREGIYKSIEDIQIENFLIESVKNDGKNCQLYEQK